MELRERLERIGLSPNETKVYLYLVDYGSSKAGKIAKGCEIQRSSAYGAINSLTAKGLLSYVTVGNVKFFQASPPQRIIEYLKEQEQLIEEAIPELQKRHEASTTEGQIKMYKGVKGVKTVFKDIIRAGEDNVVFGDDGNMRKRLPVFRQQFVREQNEKRIRTKVLTRVRSTSHSKGSSYRFVDKETESNMAVNVYGDKIGIIIWTDTPEAVIIENRTAAKSMRSYFDFMWNNAALRKQ